MYFEEHLPWPWTIFGCSRQEGLEVLSSRLLREQFEVVGSGLQPIMIIRQR